MAYVKWRFRFPDMSAFSIHNASASVYTMDADGEMVGLVSQAPKSGTISEVYVSFRELTQFPTNGVQIGLQNVSNGLPDGTDDQTVTIASTPGIDTWAGGALDTGRVVSGGDQLAVVVSWAGAFTAGDDVDLHGNTPNGTSGSTGVPSGWLNSGGWSRNNYRPSVYIVYSDGDVYSIGINIPQGSDATVQQTFSSATTPDELGCAFATPIDCKIDHADFMQWLDGPCDFKLYEGSTLLETVSLTQTDINGSTNGSIIRVWFPETEITAGTTYRITIAPTDTTSSFFYRDIIGDADLVDSIVFNGENSAFFYLTQRTDAGTFTDTTTILPHISVGVSEVDPTSGAKATVSEWWSAVKAAISARRRRRFP